MTDTTRGAASTDAAPDTPTEGAAFDLDTLAALPPEEAVQVLLEELETARKNEASYLDRLQRVTAEFENFRKRTLREKAELRTLGSERVVSAILPTLDSFDAAMAHDAESETEKRLLEGIAGTYNQLMDVLSREGLSPIPAVGEEFDPNVHEAVSAPPNASGPLEVVSELRRGYKLKDRVLRPALVALGLRKSGGEAEAGAEPSPESNDE